jgi:hypothetical protein
MRGKVTYTIEKTLCFTRQTFVQGEKVMENHM